MRPSGTARARNHPALAWLARRSGILISIVSLAGVIWWATNQGAPEFPSSDGKLALVGAAIALYAVATLVRGWRWHRILHHSGVEHRRSDAYGLVAVGYMGNTVLPLRGGELLRMVLLEKRSNARHSEVLGSIIAERLLDAIAIALLFIVLTLASVSGTAAGDGAAWAALAVLAAGVLGLGAYRRLRSRGRLESFAARVRALTRATRTLLGGWGAAMLTLTIAIWGLEGGVFCLIAQSLGLQVAIHEALALVVLASFFSMIPAAPGYVGTYDAAIALGLKGLGITGSAAVSFTLMARFVVYVPITAVGLALLIVRYGGLGELKLRRLQAENLELEQREHGRAEPTSKPATESIV